MKSDSQVKPLDADVLYRRFGPMVMRRCRRMLRNEEAAADAMQETFVRVLRHRDELTVAHPSSLLYRIATNVCLNILRDSRRRPTVSAEPLLPLLQGRQRLEDDVLDAFVLEQVFSGARAGTRTAAEMLFLEGRTLAETAEVVDLSISGVRKRIRTLRDQNLALLQ